MSPSFGLVSWNVARVSCQWGVNIFTVSSLSTSLWRCLFFWADRRGSADFGTLGLLLIACLIIALFSALQQSYCARLLTRLKCPVCMQFEFGSKIIDWSLLLFLEDRQVGTA